VIHADSCVGQGFTTVQTVPTPASGLADTPTTTGSTTTAADGGSATTGATGAGAGAGATSATATDATSGADTAGSTPRGNASSPTAAAAAESASSSSQSTFTLPGKKLSVLPIGLAVFAGISVIALIVVGLVTYERTKYRKVRKRRVMAVVSIRTDSGVYLGVQATETCGS
jgi:hypothetical protein